MRRGAFFFLGAITAAACTIDDPTKLLPSEASASGASSSSATGAGGGMSGTGGSGVGEGGAGGEGGQGGEGGAPCVPAPDPCGAAMCGSVTDSCGDTVECGMCTAPEVCTANQQCCAPKTSCDGLCGPQDDGCGGTLQCDDVCGGGGDPNLKCEQGACKCTDAQGSQFYDFALKVCMNDGTGAPYFCGMTQNPDVPAGCTMASQQFFGDIIWCCQ